MSEQSESGQETVILACGPDTVYYTIRPTDRAFVPVREELPQELQEELEAYKQHAQQADEPVPTRWAFEGETLLMKDKGGSQYKWIMENKQIRLCIGRGKKTGIVGEVRLSSRYLWGCGSDLGLALTQVHQFLTLIYGQYITLDQSRLDLAVDVLNLDMSSVNVKECFISRAVKDGEYPALMEDTFVDGPSEIHRRWKKLSGLTFGKHTSPVSAVIYNKTNEIKYQSKDKIWMHDIWRHKAQALGIAYDETMPVMRIEARLTRTAFREFPEVSGAYDALNHIPELWSYAVGHAGGDDDGLPDGWLRYVIPSGDTNRARWPVHPSWEVIQHAFEVEELPESDYEREEREKEELLQEADDYFEKHPLPTSKTPFKRTTKKPVVEAPSLQPEQIKRFIRKRVRQVNMRKGVAQITGWLMTIEAWRRGSAIDSEGEQVDADISDTLHFIAEESQMYLVDRSLDFTELVNKRRVAYFLQEAVA